MKGVTKKKGLKIERLRKSMERYIEKYGRLTSLIHECDNKGTSKLTIHGLFGTTPKKFEFNGHVPINLLKKKILFTQEITSEDDGNIYLKQEIIYEGVIPFIFNYHLTTKKIIKK